MKGVEPYLQEALQKVEQLKEAETARSKALEATIDTHRGDSARRKAAADAYEAGSPSNSARGHHGEPNQLTAHLDPAAVLCAGTAAQLQNDFDQHIRATAATNGRQITALRQGYLRKRGSGMRREWAKRFFVLDSQGQLYYYSDKVLALSLPFWFSWPSAAC
ncbi:hypothetical protein MMC29_001509 [Sticta canariensis]|nr:hypothetical protein [Sticta canariensis]